MAEHAAKGRRLNIEVMDIYEVQSKKCASPVVVHDTCQAYRLSLVPTRAEIHLELSKRENAQRRTVGASAWILSGIKIEELRYVDSQTRPYLRLNVNE